MLGWKNIRISALQKVKTDYRDTLPAGNNRTYMVFSQLNFDGLGVRADGSLCVQSGVCVGQPGLQLGQGMLELTQSQQGSLQFVLW